MNSKVLNPTKIQKTMEDKEKLREQILWTLCRYRDGGKKSVEVVASEIMQLITNPIPDMNKEWQVIEYKHIPTSEALGKPVLISDVNSKYWKDAQNNLDNEWIINAVKVSNEIYRVNDRIVWDWAIPDKYVTIESIVIKENRPHIKIKENGSDVTHDIIKLIGTTWNLRHYVPIEEEKVESVEMNIGNIHYTIPIDMAQQFNKVLIDSLESYKVPVPVEKEPKVVPLLVTEDKVNIAYHHYKLYGVNTGSYQWITREEMAINVSNHDPNYKWFSTEATRDHWVLNNKPLFSIHEIEEVLQKSGLSGNIGDVIIGLQVIAKAKINNSK